MQMTSFNPIAL